MPDGNDQRSRKMRPRAPGWYPDPWSATGSGERYWDGKRWGTTEKPLGRHTFVDPAPQPLGARSRRRRVARSILIILVLVGAVWFVQTRNPRATNRRVASSSTTSTALASVDRPPPSGEESATPLGTPAAVPTGNGKYEILRDQPGEPGVPVAWDPCRAIYYVVNPQGEPPDGTSLIQSAIARVQVATGLHFVDDGLTTETPAKDRLPYQPTRYGAQRWAPVLIAWSDEETFPSLAGYIAGIGAPRSAFASNNRLVYVSGQVILDRNDLAAAAMPDRGTARAVILHELGHLVGLDHTSDRTEIMFSEAQFNVRDYGIGDLQGLALLGTRPCYPNT